MLAPFKVQGNPQRILEVGQNVHEFDVLLDEIFQFVRNHAVSIGVHGHILRTVGIPCLESAKIGG